MDAETTKLGLKVQFKPPKGSGKLAGGALGVIGLVGAIARLLPEFPSPLTVQLADGLFIALACGWMVRSGVHGIIRYFSATNAVGAPRWRLMRVSTINAAFAVTWLSGGILLIQHPDPLLTLAAAAVASVLVFGLSLWTLAAAQQARRDRGSEWMRAHLLDPLEPSDNTLHGWLLITLIEWRSAPSKLSTFVAGTLALLAVCAVAMVPATLHLTGSDPVPKVGQAIQPPSAPMPGPAPAAPECAAEGHRVSS